MASIVGGTAAARSGLLGRQDVEFGVRNGLVRAEMELDSEAGAQFGVLVYARLRLGDSVVHQLQEALPVVVLSLIHI